MTLPSLRLRMMGLAVVWVAVSLIAAGVALQYLFSVNIERSSREDMEATLMRLAATIVPSTEEPSLSKPLPDPRYAIPFGGRYWQIEALDTGEIARSRSLWDFVIDAPSVDNVVHHETGPDDRHLILLTRRFEIGDGEDARMFLVTVGQDHGPIHDATQQFGRDVVQVLLLLGALITLAAWLQIKLGLSPISRVKRAIEAVRAGDAERLDGAFPRELGPLVQEVNRLLDAREAMMDRARSRAADLAHGLKTPLAALHGIVDRLREKGNDAEADLLENLSFEMSERVDYQMRLAALRVRTTAHSARSSLNTAVIRTLTVLKKTGRGESLHWIAELSDDCWVDVHRQDLMELVGITLENAAKWAASRVIVRSGRDADNAVLEICDDGPGIPEDQLKSLGMRGLRLDQSLPGSGLGLAIAGDILEMNQGSMSFSRAQIGGLIVTITLPLVKPGALAEP
ncbi:ATP-binding protein [Devosia ginsengisoli]|uniref:histidine kinase n=1 Tax=Devosia ginsengisoli TaxID=400770 RepID=A0A5B8LVG3_9HYPH|nr:HAMP domain-containing sensor histidine kinase [Devosia ginsengisoli]QDZ11594.1 HAMP domain-containing histidine kinase [Devosia ginsengisoli]